jgi:pilus assembly protein Flp/PilA
MLKFFERYFHDTRGITAIEYGLIAGVLALGIMSAVGGVAGQLQTTFNSIIATLRSGSPSANGS